MEPTELRLKATEHGYSLGFSYIPLSGKKPVTKGWTKHPRESLEQALKYAEKNNVGIRTGNHSGGLVVVDIDTGADISSFDFPDTVTVETGTGGRHLYYRTKADIGNSASKLTDHVDIRGNGGQVVAVGSIHPNTKKMYRYILSPDEHHIAMLPQWIVQKLLPKKTEVKPKTKKKTDKHRYIQAAVDNEVARVQNSPEGTRNNTLNIASFALGQFIMTGHITEHEIMSILLEATTLPAGEAKKTIESGIDAGKDKPRDVPEQTTHVESKPDGQNIMVPGSHNTPDRFYEVQNDTFAKSVLKTLPKGAVYTRGGIPVEIVGEPGKSHIDEIAPDRMRIVIDSFIRLIKWKQNKQKKKYPEMVPCNRDNAKIIIAHIPHFKGIPEIKLFTNYPIYSMTWDLAKPGLHNGVFYDEPPALKKLDPNYDPDVFHDLLIDFPWAHERDKANFIGLMLTPLIRPAIYGNVPMHLIKSSLPRTGKSKLAEQVLGGIYYGVESPAMQISGTEDERDKRIIALLMRGDTIVHVDNVSSFIDSPSLASLITARTWRGRVLGMSKMIDIENNLVMIGTGNNPRASGEIVRRVVPITLQPKTDHPELRTDFIHKHIFEYVLENRHKVLCSLIGLVESWKEVGRPGSSQPMGGFESWANTIGGILEHNGIEGWMQNWQDWIKNSDPEGEDLRIFITEWWEKFKVMPVTASDLLDLCEDIHLFGPLLNRSKSDQGRVTILSTKILSKYVDAPVGGYMIRKGTRRSYYLDEIQIEEGSGNVPF